MQNEMVKRCEILDRGALHACSITPHFTSDQSLDHDVLCMVYITVHTRTALPREVNSAMGAGPTALNDAKHCAI